MVDSYELAAERIIKEANDLSEDRKEPVTALDGEYSRVDLCVLKTGLSPKTLAKLFFMSARKEELGRDNLEKKLARARKLICEGRLPFSLNEFDKALSEWKAAGYPAISHSEAFRKLYNPSYRVILNRYIPYLPLLSRIDTALEKGALTLAIEGGSASGKTTLSEIVNELYGATVFHMDDFFLRPEQRTKERYSEIGGNIDRERFLCEVLIPHSRGEVISYRRFDCGSLKLCPPVRTVPGKLTVIEGAYSMHRDLAAYYGLSVFLDISPELQKKRISVRNSPEMAERFHNEWIPLEERYFREWNIKEKCDMIIKIKN